MDGRWRAAGVQPSEARGGAELLPLCAGGASGGSLSGAAGGLLTGKYGAATVPANSRLAARPNGWGASMRTLFVTLAGLTADGEREGRTLTAHALLELLAAPAVTSLIVGATRPAAIARPRRYPRYNELETMPTDLTSKLRTALLAGYRPAAFRSWNEISPMRW